MEYFHLTYNHFFSRNFTIKSLVWTENACGAKIGALSGRFRVCNATSAIGDRRTFNEVAKKVVNNILALFFGVSFVLSLLVQLNVATWSGVLLRSMVVGGIVCSVFQILNYIHIGYLDPFFVIALLVQLVGAAIVGVVVGAAYLFVGKHF